MQEYIGYWPNSQQQGTADDAYQGAAAEKEKARLGRCFRTVRCNVKNGSVGKVSENRFARADLEHIHLMIDDDMRMEALKQTNYVKSIVTAQDKMDLEKEGQTELSGLDVCASAGVLQRRSAILV